MAKCPKCSFELKLWHVKAECPSCGVNIPNYNWEERLEEDAAAAELAFEKMHRTTAKMKFSFAGTKLRIFRIPISVLPLFTLLLPMVHLSFSIPYFSEEKSYNVISIVQAIMKFNFSAIPGYISSSIAGSAAVLFLLSIILFAGAALSLLVTLLFFLLNYKNLKSKGMFITNLCAACFVLLSGILFSSFLKALSESTIAIFSGGLKYGIFICGALFLLSAVINLIVSRQPIKKDFDEKNKNQGSHKE